MKVLVTYDKKADAAYVALVPISPGEAVRQRVVAPDGGGELVLDFDREGYLLGIEALNASRVLRRELLDRAVAPGSGRDGWSLA